MNILPNYRYYRTITDILGHTFLWYSSIFICHPWSSLSHWRPADAIATDHWGAASAPLLHPLTTKLPTHTHTHTRLLRSPRVMSACRVAAKLSLSHAFCVLPYVLLPLQWSVSCVALFLLFLLLLLLLFRVIVHVVICIGQTAVDQWLCTVGQICSKCRVQNQIKITYVWFVFRK